MKTLPRTFHIQTFGCQMNAGDSDWLIRSLEARGFVRVPFEEAAFHILNTCSVREKAEQKVYSELGRIARYCKVHGKKDVAVCVGGCVAQQAGEALARRFREVRLVFGTDGIAHAPEAISRLAENPGLKRKILDFAGEYEERDDPRLIPGADAANIPPSAFVNIMQGCNNFCTYCIVPYVRGRQKSRAPEHVLAECQRLVEGGAREITLLGQNVNSYGQDEETKKWRKPVSFAELLHQVAAIPGLLRLRFVTSHPKDIAPEVIDAFGRLPVLCPRLHLPLQSGSDRMLHAMNRRYDIARYMDIVARLKAARPDMLLTTDIIVGFPGETEEDFEATMRIMREVGFASSFSFVYSDRPGAKAVLLPGKVERKVALERLSRLQAWQNQASDRLLASQIGEESIILLEAKSRMDALLKEGDLPPGTYARQGGADQSLRECWQGKTPHGFIVNVELDDAPGPGEKTGWAGRMLPVRIEAAARHSLKGKQAGLPW